MSILTLEENKSSPSTEPFMPIRKVNNNYSVILDSGSPLCFHVDQITKKKCSNRSVPGHIYCGPHGGKLTLRSDGTLGIIGPGCYRAIATLSGLNHRYVSQVLQGKSNPTSSVLERIAKVVGVEIGWLVDYIGSQKNGIKSS